MLRNTSEEKQASLNSDSEGYWSCLECAHLSSHQLSTGPEAALERPTQTLRERKAFCAANRIRLDFLGSLKQVV